MSNPNTFPQDLLENIRRTSGEHLGVCSSYLDLHSVAHVDSDDVAAVDGGVKGGAGLRWSFDVALWSSQVQLTGNCKHTHTHTNTHSSMRM